MEESIILKMSYTLYKRKLKAESFLGRGERGAASRKVLAKASCLLEVEEWGYNF